MAESDKIRRILKGVDDVAFQTLLARNPSTASEVVTLCQSYDDLREELLAARNSLVGSLSDLTVAADDSSQMVQIK